jgi:phosphoglucosamine mutase
MISASHNPFPDNGVKFFSRDGFKLPDEVEDRIEQLMFSEEIQKSLPAGPDLGSAQRIDDAAGRYIVFLKKTFPSDLSLEGLRIAIDCANGAAYRVAPTVLSELGAELIPMATEPNGTNINEGCGALHPAGVARAARQYRADLGIALDGDADRVVLVDEQGEIVDGDRILAMCAFDLHERGELRKNRVVGTVMSNLGLETALRARGIELIRTQVGDRNVVEEMRQQELNLGGEQSGHVVFLDHNTTCDGMLTALQVLAQIARTQRPLSRLSAVMEPLPQIQRAVPVRSRPPLEELPELTALLERITRELHGKGRILVRYSGTEPILRVMLEGEGEGRLVELADEVCALIQSLLGEETK